MLLYDWFVKSLVAFFNSFSVTLENVACVYFFLYIIEASIIAVGYYGL